MNLFDFKQIGNNKNSVSVHYFYYYFKEEQVYLEKFENKIWLSSPTMHGDELKYVSEAYETNWMSTVGENINEVERITTEKIGCKYAVGLSAGTAALHLAVKLAGVKPGDKVFAVI